jgi:hypothetical protein
MVSTIVAGAPDPVPGPVLGDPPLLLDVPDFRVANTAPAAPPPTNARIATHFPVDLLLWLTPFGATVNSVITALAV